MSNSISILVASTAPRTLSTLSTRGAQTLGAAVEACPVNPALIGRLLKIPSGDQRSALALCLTLDNEQRTVLDARVIAIEEEELTRAGET
jgi:hypothetical protein